MIREELNPSSRFVDELRRAALGGPAHLSVAARQTLFEGTGPGGLYEFGRAVANRAFSISANDIEALRRDGHDEDVIFEAAICAALGAATRRLDRLIACTPRAASGLRGPSAVRLP